jgi:hypothetical protein
MILTTLYAQIAYQGITLSMHAAAKFGISGRAMRWFSLGGRALVLEGNQPNPLRILQSNTPDIPVENALISGLGIFRNHVNDSSKASEARQSDDYIGCWSQSGRSALT